MNKFAFAFALILVVVLMSACAPAVATTPDPAKIECWSSYVPDGKYAVGIIGEPTKPVWNEWGIVKGTVATQGLNSGENNLIGLALGQDVKYEITGVYSVVNVYKMTADYNSCMESTTWLSIDVPEGKQASINFEVKTTSP